MTTTAMQKWRIPGRVERLSGKRGGFTLIEIIVAMGIFSVTILAFLQTLMSVYSSNNAVAAGMTIDSALRAQVEEIYAAGVENSAAFSEYARAVINHYGTKIATVGATGGDDGIAIGPNGQVLPRVDLHNGILIYRFPLPEPGAASRYVVNDPYGAGMAGEQAVSPRGRGEIHFYLDERLMPTNQASYTFDYNDYAVQGDPDPVWDNLGDNPGEDGDGEPRVYTIADLANPDEDVTRLFADVIAFYYADDGQTVAQAVGARRIAVSGNVSSSKLFAPEATGIRSVN